MIRDYIYLIESQLSDPSRLEFYLTNPIKNVHTSTILFPYLVNQSTYCCEFRQTQLCVTKYLYMKDYASFLYELFYNDILTIEVD